MATSRLSRHDFTLEVGIQVTGLADTVAEFIIGDERLDEVDILSVRTISHRLQLVYSPARWAEKRLPASILVKPGTPTGVLRGGIRFLNITQLELDPTNKTVGFVAGISTYEDPKERSKAGFRGAKPNTIPASVTISPDLMRIRYRRSTPVNGQT